jgi:tRNA(Arg) A34 adenosine deaminase TadA
MCLGAIYWARPDRVIFANTKEDAAAIDFDDHFIYSEINANMHDRKIPFFHLPSSAAKEVFEEWKKWDGKKPY